MANERILRIRDIRVIGPEGEQLGILQSRQALDMAREQGLDLVLVAPNAQPPVAKIIDYGHFKYEQRKREKENKRKTQDVKGIKISPRIAEHDMTFNIKKARKFLEEGDKVRFVCQFRAREITHPEIGRAKLDRIARELEDLAAIERPPTLEGKLMAMVLYPKPGVVKPQGSTKNAEAENQQDSSEEVQSDGVGQDHPTTDA